MRLGILRSPSLLHANLAAAAMFGSYAGFQFLVTLYVQDSLGWTPIGMALAFLPAGLIVVLGAPRIDPVIQRLGPRPQSCSGSWRSPGLRALPARDPSMPYAEFLLPTMLLIGIGFGLSFAAINAQATAGVADHEQGFASGLVNTSLQVGGAIVLAVVTAMLGTQGTPVHDQLLPGMKTAIDVVVAVSAGATVLTLTFLYRSRRAPIGSPDTNGGASGALGRHRGSGVESALRSNANRPLGPNPSRNFGRRLIRIVTSSIGQDRRRAGCPRLAGQGGR